MGCRYVMDFEETGKLGHGSFCSVFRCVRRMDGCEYAMKVSKHSVSGRMAKQRQRQEVLALAALAGCPFVVRYFSAWEEEGKQYVQVRRITRGITTHFLALKNGWRLQRVTVVLVSTEFGIVASSCSRM